jgi:hypothetical protein
VGFEDRIDFLGRRDLLIVDNATARLIDDVVSQLTKMRDLFPQCFNGEDIAWRLSGVLGGFHGVMRVFQGLFGNADQLPVFGDLLGFSLGRCHPLQFVHATFGGASALGITRQLMGRDLT